MAGGETSAKGRARRGTRSRRGRRAGSGDRSSPSRAQHADAAAVRLAETFAIGEQTDVLHSTHGGIADGAASSRLVPCRVTLAAHAGADPVLRLPRLSAGHARSTEHTGDLTETEHRESSSRRPRRGEGLGGTTTFVRERWW